MRSDAKRERQRSRTARIGALEAGTWAGLVFSDLPGEGFAIRFAVEREARPVDAPAALEAARTASPSPPAPPVSPSLPPAVSPPSFALSPFGSEALLVRTDGAEMQYLVHEAGPHAPDGSYARVSFDTDLPFGLGPETPIVGRTGRRPGLILEWSRTRSHVLVGRARVDFRGDLELRAFFPWDWSGVWTKSEEGVLGVSDTGRSTILVVARGHKGETVGRWRLYHGGRGEPPYATFRFPTHRLVEGDLLFTAALAASPTGARSRIGKALRLDVPAWLEASARKYEESRVLVAGEWQDLAAAVTDSLRWTILMQPETGDLYAPAGRRWIFPAPDGRPDHWTIFGRDSFLSAIELAVDDPELARSALLAALATQYENGCVPNWRSRRGGTRDRSHPPLAAFAALKLFGRWDDAALLAEALPALERWSRWWREPKRQRPRRGGNGNGLFSWGCDENLVSPSAPPWEAEADGRQRALWESGQDDLPSWDDARWVEATESLDVDSVDLNSYLVLDLECVSRVARVLGEDRKAEEFRDRRDELAARVDQLLWDESAGVYRDRARTGRLSKRLAAGNFLPLLAGIPSTQRARRMVGALSDQRLFWGKHVFPTISRDDPAFADQRTWRGAISPPMNYLLYQGLRRYGFDDAAAALARRSVDLFLGAWREHQMWRESYDARTGAGLGRRHQSWGSLLGLLGIEEFVDVTPWEGLRIGSSAPPQDASIHRQRIGSHRWTVAWFGRGMAVERDDRLLLTASRPVVLRRVRIGAGSLEAEVKCDSDVDLLISPPGGGDEARLRMGDATGEIRAQRRAGFTVALRAGRHDLELRLRQ